MTVKTRVFLTPPDVDELEAQAVQRAVRSGWVAPLGSEVDSFESEFSAYVGAESAAALSSGTAALHLACHLHGLGPGSWVLAPSLTFVATLNAIRYTGADVTLVDCDPTNLGMDLDAALDLLEACRREGRLPDAVMLVDLYGYVQDTTPLRDLCRELEIPVIEDAAEALGSSRAGVKAGALGDVGAFSFNGNKIITTSGGGMLVGPKELVDRARWLAAQARDHAMHYQHAELGFNYRMSNVLAALGRTQLEKLPRFVDRRREIHEEYHRTLAPVGLTFYAEEVGEYRNCWLSVGLLPEGGVTPAEVCRLLASEGIEARPGWKPMHMQPLFEDSPFFGGTNAEAFFQRAICLPSGSSLSEDSQEEVVASVRRALEQKE